MSREELGDEKNYSNVKNSFMDERGGFAFSFSISSFKKDKHGVMFFLILLYSLVFSCISKLNYKHCILCIYYNDKSDEIKGIYIPAEI